MKKLIIFLFALTLFACNERKADPREAKVLEFLNVLKSNNSEIQLTEALQMVQQQLNKSDEIRLMTYAEAQSRSIEVPYITDYNTEDIFVVQMDNRYAFCVMKGEKIEALFPLWK